MAWAEPVYQRKEIDEAGKVLAQIDFPVTALDAIGALAVINNWRSSHSFPLNTFQLTLRKKGRKLERGVIVAQRIKRLELIHGKLVRQPSMRMSQMQDIAGCRAVFKNMVNVRRLVQRYKTSKFIHVFKGEKDYITDPKSDGYRCHHLVYEYQGKTPRRSTPEPRWRSKFGPSCNTLGRLRLRRLGFLRSRRSSRIRETRIGFASSL